MANRIIRPADWQVPSRAKSGSDMEPKIAPRRSGYREGDDAARFGKRKGESSDSSKFGVEKVQKSRVQSRGKSVGDSRLGGVKQAKVPAVNRGISGDAMVPKMATRKATKGNLKKNG
jgi:hypothetical protein